MGHDQIFTVTVIYTIFDSSYGSATPLRWPNLVLKKCEEEEEEEEEEENVGPII